jgi:hypothetical protein
MATLTVEENLRAEPQGVVLGRLEAGTVFPVRAVVDRWVQVEVEGWVWTRSLMATDRLGFDLVVSASPRENLRTEPSGDVLGRLVEGTLLEEREGGEAVPGWTPVRRVAWIWASSVDVDSSEASADRTTPDAPAEDRGGETSAVAGERSWLTPSRRVFILTGPDGDTLGTARPGREVRILAREGNWTRVRVEGWVWTPSAEEGDSPAPAAPTEVSPADVAGQPDAFEGTMVSWDLQFVSLERAERIRTDFYEGEPFLLTRTSASSGDGFVYVAVPPERLEELEGLIPLERIRVVGRVRTGAAALTGNPILDLLELTRLSRD